MSEDQSAPEPTQAPETIPFAEFLESVPPGQVKRVKNRVPLRSGHPGSRPLFNFYLPEIQLHCPSETCNGTRFFRADDDAYTMGAKTWDYTYIDYSCANCQKQKKTFAIGILIQTGKDKNKLADTVLCYKFGEQPPYGPPTPSRLIAMIGTNRDLFLKGRRCENQGLGIGAFVYYRRVVEDQKNRILGEIIKVAQTISAPPETIAALEAAQREHQFSKAVDSVKDAIPQRLLIDGQNPLTLLHAALSKGLHNHSDARCLELATDIRLILAELAELLGHALKDERELKEAVARLRSLPS